MNNQTVKNKATTAVLVKSSFWYTVSGFLSKALVFLTTPLFTRLLTKEEYGNFTVFASWQSILMVICGLEVYGTLNRARFDFTKEGELDSYISSSLLLSTFFTTIVIVFYFFFPDLFHKVFLMDEKYMIVMFLYLLFYPAFGMFQAKQRIEYKYKLNAIITFILVISATLFSVGLAFAISSDRLWGRIVGQYGPYIIAGLLLYYLFLKKSYLFRIAYMKYALRLAVPLVFSYLGSTLLLSSDNIVVKQLCSGEQVSYISITHTCAHIILILVQLLNGAWSPWFYDKLNAKEYNSIQKSFSAYVWMVIAGTLAVLMFTPEIIKVLGGETYMEAIYIVPVNILNGIFSVFTYQFVNLETFYKKPEYSAVITAIVAAINIGLDIIGVKIWGYRAVCYATLLCQILLICIHYICTKRMGIELILPKQKLLIYLFSSIVLIPISFALYRDSIIRLGFIIVIGIMLTVFLLINRKKLIYYLRKVKSR